MSHLTEDQILKVMIGGGAPDERQHAGECRECALELARLAETLSSFRGSVQQWAGKTGGPVPDESRFQAPVRSFRISRVTWMLATAVLILLVAIPRFKNNDDRQRQTQQFAEDALLLERINADLSRDVPAPMEPIVNLLSNAPQEKAGDRK